MPAKMPAAAGPKLPSAPGEVQIELDGETVTLKPTLRAAQMVNASLNGFRGAFESIARFDLDAFALVVAAGLGKTTQAELDEVAEKVFRTGLVSLSDPLTKYAAMLSNGGRPPAPAKTGDAGAASEGNAD